MTRFLDLSTAVAAMLALSAPAVEAGFGINGPALDGRQVALPDGSQIVSRPAAEEVNGLHVNGPALDGRQVAAPDPAGLRIDHERLPGETRGILPIDRRGPGSGHDPQVQQ
jgi:hypothetical protein